MQHTTTARRLVRRKEAAQRWGVGISTTYDWERDGRIPKPTALSPSVKGWTEQQVEAVLAGRGAERTKPGK
jgi:predicted DNA-binding transcriptional regulator AlpA